MQCVDLGGRRIIKKPQPPIRPDSKPNKYFFQAEDGIRDVERSRGLGDVYKRQDLYFLAIFQALNKLSKT